VQEYTLSTHLHRKISSDVAARCASQQDPRTLQFCEVLERDRAEFEAAGCSDFPETGAMVTVLHSGRDRCTMTTFQTAIAAAEDETPFTTRTGQGILSYLGELIAAQNYSAHRYTPELFY
jgi:hypothetical protein